MRASCGRRPVERTVYVDEGRIRVAAIAPRAETVEYFLLAGWRDAKDRPAPAAAGAAGIRTSFGRRAIKFAV